MTVISVIEGVVLITSVALIAVFSYFTGKSNGYLKGWRECTEYTLEQLRKRK